MRIIILALLIIVFTAGSLYADTVQWKVSEDGTLLAGQFKGQKNVNSENWVLGVWTWVSESGSPKVRYEFSPGRTFQQTVTFYNTPRDKSGKPIGGTMVETFRAEGTYKIIDENTVELNFVSYSRGPVPHLFENKK